MLSYIKSSTESVCFIEYRLNSDAKDIYTKAVLLSIKNDSLNLEHTEENCIVKVPLSTVSIKYVCYISHQAIVLKIFRTNDIHIATALLRYIYENSTKDKTGNVVTIRPLPECPVRTEANNTAVFIEEKLPILIPDITSEDKIKEGVLLSEKPLFITIAESVNVVTAETLKNADAFEYVKAPNELVNEPEHKVEVTSIYHSTGESGYGHL